MRTTRVLSIGATAVLVGAALAGSAVSAQEASMAAHPAHIHAGTCPTPGNVVAELGAVSGQFLVDGTASASAESIGQATAVPVEASITTVALPLADIAAGGHAIVVHKSLDEMGVYILCGDIGGHTIGSADLPIGLAALNDSGYSGIAWLHDNGDGSTAVNLFATRAPAATAQTLDITLSDFAVGIRPTTTKVGEPITFLARNAGVQLHEMVLEKAGDADVPLAADGAESEIEDIEVGTTKEMTWTITEPGTYQLACHITGHYESGMVATFEVVE